MAKLCLYKLESDDDDEYYHDHDGGLRLRSLKLQPPTGLLVIPRDQTTQLAYLPLPRK
jgi:hypothetical protein